MNNSDQMHRESRRRRVIQNVLLLLALLAIAQAAYTASDYGNYWGEDEWWVIYTASRGSLTVDAYRPLGLIWIVPVYWLVGPHMGHTQLFLTALRVANAFLIYLIVRQFPPKKPLFAFACGALYLTFAVNDLFWVVSYNRVGGFVVVLFFTLLAIYLYVGYLARPRPMVLLLAVMAAFVSIMMYEAGIPLLIAASLSIFVYRGHISRVQSLGCAIWLAAVLLFTQNYVLRMLGVLPSGYGAALFVDLNPVRMLRVSILHLVDLFSPVMLAEPIRFAPYRLPILTTLVAYLIGSVVLEKQAPVQGNRASEWPDWKIYLAWLAVGLVVTWLGFAAYLPTVIVVIGDQRQDFFAVVGVAITLASLTWLVGVPIAHVALRRVVRALVLALVVGYGVSATGWIQNDYYHYEATWETEAIYMRSLAAQIPEIAENTLLIYIQPPGQGQVPFTWGWSFEYCLRYVYEDRATGIVPDDNQVVSSWSIQEDGIAIAPKPGLEGMAAAYTAFYRWDEIIFVTRDENYRAVILEEIPAEFYTPERAEAYNPYGRIEVAAFISERVRDLYPPIQRCTSTE